MKLHIYDRKGKVVKTYEKEAADLMFFTIEDVAEALELKSGEKIAIDAMTDKVTDFINTNYEKSKSLVKGVFDELTDDELKMTKMAEYIAALVELIGCAISFLGKTKNSDGEDDEKN